MPFKRKTLSELRTENQQFMQAELEKVGALLRFGNLKVLADMDAGMAHLHYAYLDYIARQCTPLHRQMNGLLDGWRLNRPTVKQPPQRGHLKRKSKAHQGGR